jgi:hypothetical protein
VDCQFALRNWTIKIPNIKRLAEKRCIFNANENDKKINKMHVEIGELSNLGIKYQMREHKLD